ncbi:TolC family protein [Elizabethkingia sp. JS20170427COW]|uniref:TolC family protein n=1 Tax=Elizabethkingia sp. JS20170427COW TaxID=2583851 RepID=UPI00111002F9|nr:TolC family protein [Elizabethkingia sp. JS20170427COW]QCX53099.1 TolC family protein [Elizabethkingia sp. JS20170427COW]
MKKIACLFLSLGMYIIADAQKQWSLQECVDYALKNNLQVLQNQYQLQSQEKNLDIAKKGYLPSVNGSISNNANFGQRVSAEGLINRTDNFNNSISIGANILVYNHGRLEKQARKAGYDVEASLYDLETIKNNISLQIAQQYLSVLLNREIVKINESAVENAQKNFDKAKKTTEAGTTALTVQYEAEAGLAREKQNLQNAKIEKERALFSLAQLLQLPNYKDFDVQPYEISEISSPLQSEDELLEKAYSFQPQIKAAQSRIKAAETQTEVSKTAYWPTISASAGIGSSYYNTLHRTYITVPDANGNMISVAQKQPGLFEQYKDSFSQQLGLSANIPIFNKGITKQQVEQAKINESIAKNDLAQQQQKIKEEVQKASFDTQANYQRYLAAVEAEKSTQLALDFAQRSYDAGKSTIYDLNIARNNFANAQGSVAQAKYNYLFSQKVLNFYAGIPLEL